MNGNKDILIIDDEEVILEAITKITSFIGFTSEACLNVEDALNKIRENEYKIIICDIMMPGKDGFQLLEILRQQKISTPVIITTGYSTLENAVKALYEGAIGFIPKPFSIDELTSIIRRGIEYGKTLNTSSKINVENNLSLMDFVPCPPKYHRLGYDSWMNKSEEGVVKVGITDLFLKSIGTIEKLEFLNIEETIYQGCNFLKITDDNDCIHQVLSPISGKIIDINKSLIDDKYLLEKDPYFLGWVYKMIPSNLEPELSNITPCSSDL